MSNYFWNSGPLPPVPDPGTGGGGGGGGGTGHGPHWIGPPLRTGPAGTVPGGAYLPALTQTQIDNITAAMTGSGLGPILTAGGVPPSTSAGNITPGHPGTQGQFGMSGHPLGLVSATGTATGQPVGGLSPTPPPWWPAGAPWPPPWYHGNGSGGGPVGPPVQQPPSGVGPPLPPNPNPVLSHFWNYIMNRWGGLGGNPPGSM